MKKYFILLLLFAFIKQGEAQFSLTFCEDVNLEGKPLMISNSFMVDNSGGLMKFYLKADDKLFTDRVDFRIYYIASTGKEEELDTFSQKTEQDWNYAWKEAAFYDPGTYRIKVYNAGGIYLTSANLIVKKS